MNRLPVQNGGEDLLCLFIEPYCDVFWLKPGDEFTVVPADEVSDPQFTVVAVEHRLVVWIFEGGDPAKVIVDYTVIDSNGTELPDGYRSALLAGAHTDARPTDLKHGLSLGRTPEMAKQPWRWPLTKRSGVVAANCSIALAGRLSSEDRPAEHLVLRLAELVGKLAHNVAGPYPHLTITSAGKSGLSRIASPAKYRIRRSRTGSLPPWEAGQRQARDRTVTGLRR
ncbi:hypothetical protein SMICM304S_00984 [Streptomyces microflavus]